jgi:hypothetical protein
MGTICLANMDKKIKIFLLVVCLENFVIVAAGQIQFGKLLSFPKQVIGNHGKECVKINGEI